MSNLDHEPKDDYYDEGLPLKQLVEKPFNLVGEQEKTRAWLAKALVFILGGTISIFLVFRCFCLVKDWEASERWMTTEEFLFYANC